MEYLKESIKKCSEYIQAVSFSSLVEMRVEESSETRIVLSFEEQHKTTFFVRDRQYREFFLTKNGDGYPEVTQMKMFDPEN